MCKVNTSAGGAHLAKALGNRAAQRGAAEVLEAAVEEEVLPRRERLPQHVVLHGRERGNVRSVTRVESLPHHVVLREGERERERKRARERERERESESLQ